ncbi:MAG TPA: DUF4159 domain-containing protein [Gemmatimonadaceae bacterium]|nr:DUF4159 domain-containing protein [Gemmatimonadaceae bacterium]
MKGVGCGVWGWSHARRAAILSAVALAATAGVAAARVAAARVEARASGSGSPAYHTPHPGVAVPRLAIARLQYDGGGDWYANPSSIPNLLTAIAERTTLAVDRNEARVTLMDDRVWDYPFLHVTGHGNIHFSDEEVVRLREYLTRGGFLHVDDNYGLDESFRREIARVFPDRPLVDVPLNHPIYHLVYDFPQGLPKIHEHDGKPARGFGIFIGDRLAVYYSYSSDLGNGWEDVGTYNDPPALHEAALRMGVNLFVYAVTSRPTP